MRGARAWLLAGAAVLVGGGAWLLWAQRTSPQPGVGVPEGRRPPADAPRGPVPLEAPRAGAATAGSGSARDGAQAAAEREARLARLRGGLAEVARLDALEAAQKDLMRKGASGPEESRRLDAIKDQQDAAEDAATQAATDLVDALQRDPALVDDALARMAQAPAEEARRLGRCLRFVEDPALVARLATLARKAPEAHHREAALHALDLRPVEQWLPVASAALEQDPDGRVRRTAAHMLGTSLADPATRGSRREIRASLRAALESPDAAQRSRAVLALALDRDAPADLRQRLEQMRQQDPDERVRGDAQAVLRAWQRPSR